MPPNPSVPDIPADWADRDAEGTPYLLGIAAGDTTWRTVVVHEVVRDEGGSLVTANERPVFVE